MTQTNEVSALNRLQKFDNINLENTKSYKLLKLTAGSYYKLFLKESSGTTIIEILNNQIYTICTPTTKYIKLDNNNLYIKGFSTISLIIEFYEEFELSITEDDPSSIGYLDYNTNGVIEYLTDFRAQKFIANEVSVKTVKPEILTCEEIHIGDWKIYSSDGSSVTVGLK